MNAIRQYHKIGEDREIKISIPEDFHASEVEIIVLPSKADYYVSEETKKMVLERKEEYLRNPKDVQDFGETIENVRKRIDDLRNS